ncbi:MAG TPA: tyrosine-type recombinase/integrase [Kofleriaceae bacterium]
MFKELFPNSETRAWISSGMAASFVHSYAMSLRRAGFRPSTLRQQIRTAAHLGHWIESEGRALRDLDEDTLQRFREHLLTCTCHHSRPGEHHHTAIGSERFLKHLRTVGVVAPRPEAPDPVGDLVTRFKSWLVRHRGVAPDTLTGYCSQVNAAIDPLGADPRRYDVTSVRQFMIAHLGSYGTTQAKVAGYALRTFLRFLVAEGLCPPEIVDAVPRFANWTLTELPRHLPPEAMEQVISTPDTCTRMGIRNRAVLLLLARLGLRARDIVELRRSDLDWKRGLVRVMGKGRRETWLPLPQDAGDAVRDYLEKARPRSPHERLFLSVRAPFRPFKGTPAVAFLVRQAIARAGVQRPAGVATHLFRHSLAKRLLAHDIPLEGIGVILRHRSLETSAQYAKIDVGTLQTVVQAWPGNPEVLPC